MPPLEETLTVLPLVAAEMLLSASRTVSEPGVLLKLAAGTKRRLVAALKNKPEVTANDGEIPIQVEPLSHCHSPCSAVAALAVTTTPPRMLPVEPPFTTSKGSEKLAANRVATVLPEGLELSSGTAARVADPLATGASLLALTVSATVSVEDENDVAAPSELVDTEVPLVPEV